MTRKGDQAGGSDPAPSSSPLPSSSSSSSSFLTSLLRWRDFSAETCAKGIDGQGGFMQAACRFYILSKPFWIATEHATGFNYYHHSGDSNNRSRSRSDAATVSPNTANESPSSPTHQQSSKSPSSPNRSIDNFQHAKLNSPEMIPRARTALNRTRAGSNGGKAIFSSPSSSPFLSPIRTRTINATAASSRGQIPSIQLEPSVKEEDDSHSSSSPTFFDPESSFPSPSSIWNLWNIYYRLYFYFHSSPRLIAWSWSLLMLFLLIFCVYLHVLMSYCQRHMSTSLANRDMELFYSTLYYYLLIMLVASPLLALSQYAKSQLSLHWRIYLTNRMLQQYFQHRNFYYLQAGNSGGAGSINKHATNKSSTSADKTHKQNGEPASASASSSASSSSSSKSSSKRGKSKSGSIDNPDQRIADDIRAFTRSSLTFLNEFLDEVFQVLAFAGILYSISPLLVFGLIVYAIAGTYIATAVFGLKLIACNTKQSKSEADFRFSLVRVRTNAEAISFYSGERAELSYIYWRFSKIVRNLSRMAGIQCNLALFKHGYGFLTLLIPPFVLSPMYFRGEVELGVISQSSMAFRQIFNSLNMVVSKMNELSKWRSGMERIWSMQQALHTQEQLAFQYHELRKIVQHADEIRLKEEQEQSLQVTWSNATLPTHISAIQTIQIRPSPHLHLSYLKVCVQGDAIEVAQAKEQNKNKKEGEAQTLVVQNGERILVQNLSLFLPSLQISSSLGFQDFNPSGGRGLLIMGRSGIGKSTLLRAIAGLWKNGSGTIYRPSLSSLLFLPQRPYMIMGTLRQQLLYPFCPQASDSPHSTHPATTNQYPKPVTQSETIDFPEARTSDPDSHDHELNNLAVPSATGLRRRWPVRSAPTSRDVSASPSPSASPVANASASLSPPLSPLTSPLPPLSTPLAAQVSDEEGIPSDEDLAYILSLVNLSHLTKPKGGASFDPSLGPSAGLDVLCDWSEVLSLGESQRIAFARILIHQPAYVFADEITAALDAQNEEKLYSALSTYAPRTCLVSVGHRPALLKHHSHVLHLQEGGQWDLLEINEKNQAAIEHITAVTTTT